MYGLLRYKTNPKGEAVLLYDCLYVINAYMAGTMNSDETYKYLKAYCSYVGNHTERLGENLISIESKVQAEKLIKKIEAGEVETPGPGAVYPPAAAAVINEYPQFAKDLPLLKKDYITDTETGYKWEKTKVSLSEYFGNMGHKPTPWKMIENLFNESGLKHSFNSNGGAYGKKKPSPDYIALQKILENTPDS
jgi:hypothetical protein